MTYSGNATEQIEEVRRRTIAVLDDLVQKADEFGLAEPPPVLERHRRKLRENTYKVPVVGGAKRGKSTFVNALLGRDVLPTDVTTSWTFNIRPSREEAYRLRFEDGSEREVFREGLPLYGSRIMADAGVITTSEQNIRWIEVDAPVRFLPEGLSLLDTPGLGTLNADRTPFTDSFVPEADAVIFVLESGQPVIEDDLEFIEEILDVTRNIFFIQTKIDRYDEGDWRGVQHLNQRILEEKFEGRLADTRVWPISSTNLRKAATGEGEEASLLARHHRKLAVALRAFLAGVVGWTRLAEAVQVAVRYHAASRQVLSEQLAGFAAESKQKRSEMQRIAAQGKGRFEHDWGPQGKKYLELRENLQRAIAVGKQSFANALQMGGDIELAQKAKIDAIKSLTEANRVGKEMPDEVVTAAMNGWARVCEEVQRRCVELLGPSVGGSDALPDPNMSGSAISNSGLDVKFKTDYFMMLRGAASGIIVLTAASVVVAAAGMSLPPLGLVALPILLVLMGSGIRNVRKNQLKSARQELRMHLVEVLQKVRRHFFDVDLLSGRFSRMEEYFGALEGSVNEQVREIVEKKSKGADAEISRLAEAMKLEDRERDAHTKQTHERLIEWDSIGKSARDVMALITEQAGTGDHGVGTTALVEGSSRVPPVIRRLDETLPVSPPGLDEKDGAPGAAHRANIRWSVTPGSVPPSSSPLSGSSSLGRYRGAVEASPAEGKSDKAKADRFDVFAEDQPGLGGERTADVERRSFRGHGRGFREADRRYVELLDTQRERLMAQLRWAVVVALSVALACGGCWFVFVGY